MGEKLPRVLPKVATSTSLLGSFICLKFTTWDRRLYFPSEGRHAEEFFSRKIRRLRPGLNPRTWVPNARTLTPRPPKPLAGMIMSMKNSSKTIGNRTCNLPTCSAVSQPPAPLPVPKCKYKKIKNKIKKK